MAVYYTGGGGGMLGTLGGILGLGGMIFDNPLLSAWGKGLGAANTLVNGGQFDQSVMNALGEALKQSGWINPASGNVADMNGTGTELDPMKDKAKGR